MADEKGESKTVSGGGKSGDFAGASAQSSAGEGRHNVDYHVVRDMIVESERKTIGKIEAIESKIESRLAKLDNVPGIWQIVFSVAGIVVTGIGIVFAILSFTGDRIDGAFSAGTAVGDKFADNRIAIEELSRSQKETNQNVDRILERMDSVISRIDGDARTK